VTVGDRLREWRIAHRVPLQANHDTLLWIRVGPLQIPVPNPKKLHWHDLHHALLGYGNDVFGEVEVSAFELRTGVPDPLIGVLCVAGVALGLVICPLRTWRAWQRAAGARNLYREQRALDEVLGWEVDHALAELSLRG
jgi:hypothetical protein